VAREAPGVQVIDITHHIPPGDVRSAAMLLARSAPWLVPAVLLAVVDPGVATSRRAVAVEVLGPPAAVLVGPDNGVLLPAARALGGPSSAVELDASVVPRMPGTGATFDGRDLFAPAAARLALGVALESLGRPIDVATLVGEEFLAPAPMRDGAGRLVATVLWVDRFGNAQLNLRPADADTLGEHIVVTTARRAAPWPARRVRAFAHLQAGELGLITDSYGQLALCMCRASAAQILQLAAGDQVVVAKRAG
jgi:S-adenosylmethionine hydrolase